MQIIIKSFIKAPIWIENKIKNIYTLLGLLMTKRLIKGNRSRKYDIKIQGFPP